MTHGMNITLMWKRQTMWSIKYITSRRTRRNIH